MESSLFQLGVVPLLVFLARVTDVSIGTVRVIFITRGMKSLSSLLGFFEVIVWLTAITQIMQHLNSPIHFIAYAGGFAMGNYVGMVIEEKLAFGKIVIRIITQKESSELIAHLKANGFGVTLLDAKGSTGPVKIIYTIILRKDYHAVIQAIQKFNPKAFFSVEDVRTVSEGIFRATKK